MPSRARLATWGLVALLAVDVALVSLAFRNPFREQVAVPGPSAVASATASGSVPVASGGVGASASAGPTTAPTVGAGASGMVAVVPVDSGHAWRFTEGTCPGGGATLAWTDNGGRTWADVPVPVGAITRVQATDTSKVLVVGAEGPGCREAALRSTDGGRTWAPGGAIALWYTSVTTPAEVVTSSGRTTKPCGSAEALSVSALSATVAAVLCENGRVVETADGGTTWVDVVRGLQAVAVTARVEASKLAALVAYRTGGCSGLQVASLAGGTTAKLGCVDLGGRSVEGLARHVGLGVEGDVWWLVVDEATFRSEDGGKTWSTA